MGVALLATHRRCHRFHFLVATAAKGPDSFDFADPDENSCTREGSPAESMS
jgi:hypothetical protein